MSFSGIITYKEGASKSPECLNGKHSQSCPKYHLFTRKNTPMCGFSPIIFIILSEGGADGNI